MRKVTVAITSITASPVQARVAIQRSGERRQLPTNKAQCRILGRGGGHDLGHGLHRAEATAMSGTLSGLPSGGKPVIVATAVIPYETGRQAGMRRG